MILNYKSIFCILSILTILTPTLTNAKGDGARNRRDRYADAKIVNSLADTTEAQVILGIADIAIASTLLRSAFAAPNALQLRQNMLLSANELKTHQVDLVETKKIMTAEEAEAKVKKVSNKVKSLSTQQLSPQDFDEMKEHYIKRELKISYNEYEDMKNNLKSNSYVTQSKKQSLIKNLEIKITNVQGIQSTHKGSYSRILEKNGLSVRAMKVAGTVIFAVDLLNRVIVWNLLNDYPGYFVDLGDLQNICFTLFSCDDWELGKDEDGSRDMEF